MSPLKLTYYLSLLFVVLLALGSVFLYQERMLFADGAFITFEIINSKWFVFSEHRYGAFITQLFPLLGVYLGLPLKLILILYSMSFYVFFLFVVLFCGRVLKQYQLGVIYVIYLSLFVSDVYFWPNNEIHQAVGWMLLFLGLYRSTESQAWKVSPIYHLSLSITLFLSTISHLLVVPLLGFLWIYQLLDKRTSKSQRHSIIYSIVILLCIGLRYWLSHDSWYDGVKLQGMSQLNFSRLVDAFQNAQSTSFLSLLITKYWFAIMIAFTSIGTLLTKKKYLLAGFTALAILGYSTLIVVTYDVEITEINRFYFESQWMGLAIILVYPLLTDSIISKSQKWIIASSFFLYFVIKLVHLSSAYTKFHARLENIETLVDKSEKANLSKAYIYESQEMKQDFLLTWGIPAETLLCSTLDRDRGSRTIKNISLETTVSSSTDSLYTAFKFLPLREINTDYFDLDDTDPYQLLEN